MSRFKKIEPHKVVADVFAYRYVIAGRPKSGKTSLIHGIVKEKYDGDLSKMLLLAFEDGYKALDGIFADDIDDWEYFQELVDDLVEEKDTVPFKILAFDTVDVMQDMCAKYVMKVRGRKDGKRYTALTDISYGVLHNLLKVEMATQIERLDKAGFNLVFLTHDKDKQFESREGLKYDKTILSLSGGVRDLILNKADFIVFIELGKELEKGVAVDKRWIYFRGDSGLEAGTRFTKIPNRIEYSYSGFIDTVENAILEEYGGDAKAVEKAKKEQEKVRESKAKEFVENAKNAKEPSELHEEILSV